MQQAGTALEQFHLAIVEERDLAKGLAQQVIGLSPVERNGSHRIGKSGFLARPPQSQVAYKAARTLRHPIQGPDDQFAHALRPLSTLDMRLRLSRPPRVLFKGFEDRRRLGAVEHALRQENGRKTVSGIALPFAAETT